MNLREVWECWLMCSWPTRAVLLPLWAVIAALSITSCAFDPEDRGAR